jgi:hypothetical protein
MPVKAGARLRDHNGKLPAREDVKTLAARSHSLVHDPRNNIYANPVMYYEHHLPQSRRQLPSLR